METYKYYKDGKLSKVDAKYLENKGIELQGLLEVHEDKNAIRCKYSDREDIYYKEKGAPLFI